MRGAGNFEKALLVVYRAIKPRHGQIVVAVVDGDFTCQHVAPTRWAYQTHICSQSYFCRHRAQGGPDSGNLGCRHLQHQTVSGLKLAGRKGAYENLPKAAKPTEQTTCLN